MLFSSYCFQISVGFLYLIDENSPQKNSKRENKDFEISYVMVILTNNRAKIKVKMINFAMKIV